MKKGVAASIISVLAIIAIALGIMHFSNNADKTKQIEVLNADIADKAGQIMTLNADVADKANQIITLKADVVDKAGQIETLNTDVADKDGQIETLNANVVDKTEQIITLNADVADKVSQIRTLNADVADKAKQIETLNDDAAGKAKEIQMLTAAVQEKDSQINALSTDVVDKAGQIETLNADIAGKTKEMEMLNANAKEKDSHIEALSADVAEKAGQIETLNADIANKASQIDTLTTDNKKKDDQIELLKEMVSGVSASPTSLETDNPLVIAPTEEFIIERLLTVPYIAKIAAATEDNDPNGQLGKQGGYIAQIFFSSPLVNPAYANKPDLDVIDAGTSSGGSIEVYATVADAEKRNRYLASFDGGALSSGSHTVVGTILVRTSSSLSASDQKKLEEEIITALTSKEIPSVEKSKESAVPTELVTIKECGYQIVDGYLKYSFIAHNNMTDKAAYLPAFRITVRDADGGLISTTDQVLNVIYPGQDTIYAGQGSQIDETPASIEVSYVEPDDDWHIVSTSKLDHAVYIPFEIKSSKLKNDKIIGELYNPNDYNQPMIAITVVFRDMNGQLLGGETNFINNVKAGETVPFELHVNKDLIAESFEVYSQPW